MLAKRACVGLAWAEHFPAVWMFPGTQVRRTLAARRPSPYLKCQPFIRISGLLLKMEDVEHPCNQDPPFTHRLRRTPWPFQGRMTEMRSGQSGRNRENTKHNTHANTRTKAKFEPPINYCLFICHRCNSTHMASQWNHRERSLSPFLFYVCGSRPQHLNPFRTTSVCHWRKKGDMVWMVIRYRVNLSHRGHGTAWNI